MLWDSPSNGVKCFKKMRQPRRKSGGHATQTDQVPNNKMLQKVSTFSWLLWSQTSTSRSESLCLAQNHALSMITYHYCKPLQSAMWLLTKYRPIKFSCYFLLVSRYLHGRCYRGLPGCPTSNADAAETSEVGAGAGAAARWHDDLTTTTVGYNIKRLISSGRTIKGFWYLLERDGDMPYDAVCI